MIITEHISEMKTNCPLPSQNFNIKASPVAFDILSSRLYSNPILAIIRELLTNAYDSHKAAGTLDKPIHVQLPDYITDNFIIRDYGIGLSKEDVLTIYTTFFDSTKATTNDFTGCFGLGSKTPFSYTNSFSVNSYFNGYKHSFIAIKKEGYPAIINVKDEPTDEPNGLEISIPVKGMSDKSKFLVWFNSYLKYIPEILVDTTVIRATPNLSIDNIKVYSESGKSERNYKQESVKGINIKQGCNIYNINSILYSDIKDVHKLYPHLSVVSGWNDIIIEVPIGKLAITPSREALSTDSSNLENIKTILKDADTKLYKYLYNANIANNDLDDAIREARNQILTDKYFQNARYIKTYFTKEDSLVSFDNKQKVRIRHRDINISTITNSLLARHAHNDSIYEGKSLVILVPRGIKHPTFRRICNVLNNYPIFSKYTSIHTLEVPRAEAVYDNLRLKNILYYKTYYANAPYLSFMKELYGIIWTLNNIPEKDFDIDTITMSKLFRMYKNTKQLKGCKKEKDELEKAISSVKNIRCTTCEIGYRGCGTYVVDHPYYNTTTVKSIKDNHTPNETIIFATDEFTPKAYAILSSLRSIRASDGKLILAKFIHKKAKEQGLGDIVNDDKKFFIKFIAKSNIKFFDEYVRTSLSELHEYLMSLEQSITIVSQIIPEEMAKLLKLIRDLILDSYPKHIQDKLFATYNYKKIEKIASVIRNYENMTKYSHTGWNSPTVRDTLLKDFRMTNFRVYNLYAYIPKSIGEFCKRLNKYTHFRGYPMSTEEKRNARFNYLDRNGKTYLLQYLLTNNTEELRNVLF